MTKQGPVFIEEPCGCRVDHGIPSRCAMHTLGRCAVCGYLRGRHCDLDAPGLDHPRDCTKMHHEFRQAHPARGTRHD